MPNTADTVNAMYVIFSSGLVVSGNNHISIVKQLVSGSAFTSFKVSGVTDYVTLSLGRPSEIMPVTGGAFQGSVKEYVVEEITMYGTYADTQQALSGLRQRVDDSKITVASGVWTSGFNLPRPYLVSERWPIPHEKIARARLEWRFQYLL